MTRHIERQREREALRPRIIDAARALYGEGGCDAVTLRAVAGRIGYSTTIIYKLFADKNELLRAVTDEDFAGLTQALGAGDRADASLPERVLGLGRSLVAFARQQPGHYYRIFINPPPPIAVEESAAERGNPDQDAYAFARQLFAALADSSPAITVRDPDLLLQMFWSAMHGAISLRLVLADEPWVEWQPLETLVEQSLLALLYGIGAMEKESK
ncbi:TetR/AcrR family transcriptional regulator [Chitinimonas lacunae]|uniref:TetR/AcrR family transcriptional regulator n=1 Tax=Chitinimonas lacunae TaxID=1963018 RepID=A0ABV8MQW6_9NEIS